MRILKIISLCGAAACTLAGSALLATEPSAGSAHQDLDQQLLEDLDSGLLDDLKLPAKKPPDSRPPVEGAPPSPAGDVKDKTADKTEPQSSTQDQIGAGEDIELGKSADPLTRIGRRMRNAKSLMDRRNTSKQTQQLQDEILDDLSALIAKLQSQQSSQSGGDPAGQGRFQAGEGSGASGEQTNQGPEKSTDRLGQSDTALSALRRQQELLRRMNWGSLPDRLRDQVRSSRVEQFLPKYARLIEQYYKRLAEESTYQP